MIPLSIKLSRDDALDSIIIRITDSEASGMKYHAVAEWEDGINPGGSREMKTYADVATFVNGFLVGSGIDPLKGTTCKPWIETDTESVRISRRGVTVSP